MIDECSVAALSLVDEMMSQSTERSLSPAG